MSRNYPRADFKRKSPELAYIIGVLMGDANLDYERETWIEDTKVAARIRLSSIDVDFLKEFRRVCWQQFGIKTHRITLKTKAGRYHDSNGYGYNRKDSYETKLGSREVCTFLSKMQNTDWLDTDDMKLAWVRGIWDSEGCISLNGQVQFSNTDEKIVKYYVGILKGLGIKFSLIHDPKFKTPFGTTNIWQATFGTYEDVINFYYAVRPTIQRKRERFEETESKFFSTDFKPWTTARRAGWTAEEIAHFQGMFNNPDYKSCSQMAKKLGKSNHSLYQKATRLGLSFQNRRERMFFKNGHPRSTRTI